MIPGTGKGEGREEGKKRGRRRGKEGLTLGLAALLVMNRLEKTILQHHRLPREYWCFCLLLGVSRRTRNEEFLRDSQRSAKKV